MGSREVRSFRGGTVARNRFVCSSCGAKTPIQAFCEKCGQPTPVCTADERILWEMGQWESSRAKQGRPTRTITLPPMQDEDQNEPYAPPRREVPEPPAPRRQAPPQAPPRPQQQRPAASTRPAAAPPRPQAPRPGPQPATQPATQPEGQRPETLRPAASTPAPPRAVPNQPGTRSERPTGPQIAAAAAASSTAHALE